MLRCYLISKEEQCRFVAKAGGIKAWLQKMAGEPTAAHPAARLCVQKALQWLPKYEGCAAGSAPKAAKLSLGDSSDDSE